MKSEKERGVGPEIWAIFPAPERKFMQLVIAEKMSAAISIAKVMGVTEHKGRYMEGNSYVVSWCVGHLVELAQPESYGE